MPACKKSRSPRVHKETIISLHITRRSFPNAPSVNLDEAAVSKWISHYTKGLSSFGFSPGAEKSNFEKPYHLDFSYTVRPIETIRPVTRKGVTHDRAFEATVYLTLRPLFTADPDEVIRGVESEWKTFPRNQSRYLDRFLTEALRSATGNAVGSIWFEADLKKAPVAKILALLDSPEVKIRMLTVGIIGRRRIPEALDKLITMLKTERYEVHKMRIAGVLGHLGDEKAVEPLSEFALSLSDEHTVAVLSIISSIGGKRAETFLQWMAFGHKSKPVQKAAKNLLDKMEKEHKRPIN
ncbi:HEAT repeat domain-containing protein [Myxococcota bacterium]|nr:HEAT repeat domain-containing protein [Myxococcota bacterium]